MPNANWSNPTLTSTYTNFVSEVKNRDEDLALQFDGTTSTNIPTGTIRWDSSANRWKKWTGAAWGELTSTYALTALTTTGSVGIGTTSPTSLLHVDNSPAGTQSARTLLSSSNSADTVACEIRQGRFNKDVLVVSSNQSLSANLFNAIENGTSRFVITGAGNVGIGTTSPGSPLEVSGGAIRSTDTAGNARSRIEVFTNGQSNNQVTLGQGFGAPTDNIGYLYNRANASLVLGTNDQERLRITSAGLVGIGTSSPGKPLDVRVAGDANVASFSNGSRGVDVAATSTGALIGAYNTDNDIQIKTYGSANNSIILFTSNAERLRVDPSGRVGIGTTSPAARLHVSTSGTGTSTGSNIVISARSEASGRDAAIQFADGTTSAYVGMLGGAIYFADSGSTERARIDSSGRLLVGTTSTTDPALVQVNGDALVNSLNAGPLAGARNRIINGGMQIDQRNSGASISSGVGAVTYSVDRWYVYATGAAVSAQRVTSSNSAFTSALRISGAASNTGVLIGQRIELQNSYDLAGKTVTLSFYAASSASVTLNWKMYYAGAANDFTTKTQSNTGTQATTSTLTKYSATFTLSASATTGVCLEFELSALTSGSVDITGVQLELGSVSTPFERRSIGAELELCQRYFASETVYGFGYTSSAGSFRSATGYLPVNMRVTPTVGVISATGSNVSGQTAEVQSYRNVGFFTSVLAAGAYTHDITFTATAEL